MKMLLCLCLALVALPAARAEILRSGGANGRHAIRPNHGPERGSHAGSHRGEYIYRDSPRVHVGVNYSSGYRHGGGFFGYPYAYNRHHHGYRYVPSYGYYGGYGYGYRYYDNYGYVSPGGAANGLLLGALAGGIIGHNSGTFGHNGWRGAAWGAGAGWLLGTVVDANRRQEIYNQPPVVVQSAQPAQIQPPAAQVQPQQVTIINNYYNTSTPMSAVNGMFGR